MPHLFDNIPPALKSRPNWVVWGIRSAGNIRDAPMKSPFNPTSLLSGRALPAKAGIRETWGGYQAAVECVRRGLAQGIGYEFGGNGVYGVDLDHVIDGAGTLTPQAREVVDKLASYTEVSPSGTGIHAFVLAPGANITRHRKKDYFLEIYSEGRYFTVTGNTIGGTKAIETRTTELQSIHDKFLLPDVAQRAVNHPPPMTAQSSAEQEKFLQTGLERDKVFAEMWAGHRRHGNESGDYLALMNKLAYWCSADPPPCSVRFYKASTTPKRMKSTKKNVSVPTIYRTPPETPALPPTRQRKPTTTDGLQAGNGNGAMRDEKTYFCGYGRHTRGIPPREPH